MLKEFLRQAEDNDMAPIKEGKRLGQRHYSPFLPKGWQGEQMVNQGLTLRPKRVCGY